METKIKLDVVEDIIRLARKAREHRAREKSALASADQERSWAYTAESALEQTLKKHGLRVDGDDLAVTVVIRDVQEEIDRLDEQIATDNPAPLVTHEHDMRFLNNLGISVCIKCGYASPRPRVTP